MKEKNIRELAKRMGLITVENMCQYTITQLVVMVANKVNELVGEVWRFETDVQEILKTQNENIKYLLDKGLLDDVSKVFDKWINDGTFDVLINQSALKKVNERIDETNARLSDVFKKRDSYDIPINGTDLHFDDYFTKDKLKATIDVLSINGYKYINLCPYLKSDSTTSNELTRLISLDDIADIINYACSKGFDVIVKQHINRANVLNPSNPEIFIQNYKLLLLETARECKKNGVEWFCVTNELANLTKDNRELWLSVINELKSLGLKVFTGLTYNESLNCVFLDQVDAIGVNIYPPLSSKGDNATIRECKETFLCSDYLTHFKKLKERYKKEIWVTEIGCVRNSQALSEPGSSGLTIDSGGDTAQNIFFRSVLPILGSSYLNQQPTIDRLYIWQTGQVNPADKFNFLENNLVNEYIKNLFVKGVE